MSYGEVTEWLKVLLSKSSVRETVPRVRIPPSPPIIIERDEVACGAAGSCLVVAGLLA